MTTPEQTRDPARGGDGDQLVDALAQLSFAVQMALTEVASAHELSLTQLRLLAIVRDRTVAMADLARHLGVDRSSATGLIDRAEKRALVQRELRPGDGRGVQVRITPAGQDLATTIAAQAARRLHALTAVLSARERADLTTLITRVIGSRD